MDGAKIKIIEFLFDKDDYTFSLILNTWTILLIVVLFFIIRWVIKKFFLNKKSIDKEIIPVTLKYKLGGGEITYQIVRNYQNIEIAHKIYIELITRKAAIQIDEEKDVIVEVYNSWYSLFQITRNELKSFDGKLLKDNNTSQELIRLLTDILNKGLRPHLTEYQARFRKWYSEQLEEDEGESPQDIQSKFEDIKELLNSMKEVNQTLIDYSEQLKKIIDG